MRFRTVQRLASPDRRFRVTLPLVPTGLDMPCQKGTVMGESGMPVSGLFLEAIPGVPEEEMWRLVSDGEVPI